MVSRKKEKSKGENVSRAQTTLLQTIIANAPIVLFALDKEGIFLRSEGKGLESLGLQPGEVVGQSVFELYKDFPQIVEDNRRALAGAAFTSTVKVDDLHFETRYEQLLDSGGNVTGVIGVATDVTEGRKAEETARENSHFLQTLIDSIPSPVFYKDREGRYLGCNKAFEEFIGVTRGEIVGKTVYDLAPRELAEKYHEMDEELFKNPGTQVYESSVVGRDGRRHNVVFHKATFLKLDGTLGGLVGIMLDITERKQAEEALKASRDRLQLFIERMPVACIMWNPDSRVEVWNPAAEEIFGFSSGEAMGRHAYDLIVPGEVQEHTDAIWHRLITGDETAHSENENLAKDGSRIVCDWHNTPLRESDGTVVGVLSMVQDITERTRAEEKIAYSENYLRSIIEAEPECVKVLDAEGTLLSMNQAGLAMIEADTPEMVIGKRVHGIVAPEHREAFTSLLRNVSAGERATLEFKVIGLKGGERWLETHAVPLRDEKRQQTLILSITRDVTDRRRTEKALRESEKNYRAIVNAIPDLMFRIDRSGTFLDYSPAKDFPTLVSPEEFLGKTVSDVMPEEVAGKTTKAIRKALETGEAREFNYEVSVDGERQYFNARIVESGKDEVLAIVRDVTEHRRLEEQLRHAQKMEAIGTLTGGVAHEFNNILTSISGFGEFLQEGLEPGSQLRTYADMITAAADRAARLTDGLLAYSRKQVTRLEPIDIGEIIKTVEGLLASLVGENILLEVAIPNETLPVMADKAQLEQVLVNLTTNAMDAMPDGGRLTIESERTKIANEIVKSHVRIPPGEYALVSVTDTGTGMDERTMKNIFEPFFTTKDVGKGTGLGLSIVYGIVRKHRGHITVESAPGKGTSFALYLPVSERMEAEKPGPSHAVRVGGIETVLLAEDDETVRKLIHAVLENAGYRVFLAADGREAVEKYHEHEDEIELLLFDVAMPEVNGKEAYDAIKASNPHIKAVFVSGYAPDDVRTSAVLDENLALVSKPVSRIRLLQAVREALG
jgi:two-component system NtrC family sensor kinase